MCEHDMPSTYDAYVLPFKSLLNERRFAALSASRGGRHGAVRVVSGPSNCTAPCCPSTRLNAMRGFVRA